MKEHGVQRGIRKLVIGFRGSIGMLGLNGVKLCKYFIVHIIVKFVELVHNKRSWRQQCHAAIGELVLDSGALLVRMDVFVSVVSAEEAMGDRNGVCWRQIQPGGS